MNTNQKTKRRSFYSQDLLIQGVFSLASICGGSFLIVFHPFDQWIAIALGVFCLFFPLFLTVNFLRKQYQFETQRSLFLDRVLTASPSVIFVYDQVQNRVHVLNGGFPTLGVSSEAAANAKGNLLEDLASKEQLRKIHFAFEELKQRPPGFVMNDEWLLRHRETGLNRTFRVNHTLLSENPEELLIIGYAEDVTNQKYTEKYSAMQDIGASIAHEIANPLAIISSQVHVLELRKKKDQLTDEILFESIERFKKNVTRIQGTVRTLRLLTVNDANELPASFDLNSILNHTKEIWFHRMKNRGFNFDVRPFASELIWKGRKSQLLSAVLNLVTFCFHELEQKKQDDPWIRVSVEILDGHIQIVVAESILKSEDHHHLFDPSHMMAGNHNVGLSLSVSKSIAQREGGDIFLDKDVANTKFVLSLPLHSFGVSESEEQSDAPKKLIAS